MATITLKGNSIHTKGELPQVGTVAPELKLTKNDLSDVSLEEYKGKKKVLNIFPSLDTPTCATSVRTFNKAATELDDTVVLNVSMDLPFAHGRFCQQEGINNVETLSAFRSNFPKEWGVEITDGPMMGLCSRAIVVLDENNKVLHNEQVSEIADEPDYQAALKALKS